MALVACSPVAAAVPTNLRERLGFVSVHLYGIHLCLDRIAWATVVPTGSLKLRIWPFMDCGIKTQNGLIVQKSG